MSVFHVLFHYQTIEGKITSAGPYRVVAGDPKTACHEALARRGPQVRAAWVDCEVSRARYDRGEHIGPTGYDLVATIRP